RARPELPCARRTSARSVSGRCGRNLERGRDRKRAVQPGGKPPGIRVVLPAGWWDVVEADDADVAGMALVKQAFPDARVSDVEVRVANGRAHSASGEECGVEMQPGVGLDVRLRPEGAGHSDRDLARVALRHLGRDVLALWDRDVGEYLGGAAAEVALDELRRVRACALQRVLVL